MPIRVFVADEQEIVRRGFADLFAREPDLVLAGEAASADEAITRIHATPVDVAVLDAELSGRGLELCRELDDRVPELPRLVLASGAGSGSALEAMLAGASGFLPKGAAGCDLVSAVRKLDSGEAALDGRSVAAALRTLRQRRRNAAVSPLTALTQQEYAVFCLLGEGLTNREIGQRIHLSVKTVKNYVSRTLHKLGIDRRGQAAVLATELRVAGELGDRPRAAGDPSAVAGG